MQFHLLKNWASPKTLIVSLIQQERKKEPLCEFGNFSRTTVFRKYKGEPFINGRFPQPVTSIKPLISHSVG